MDGRILSLYIQLYLNNNGLILDFMDVLCCLLRLDIVKLDSFDVSVS